MIYDAFRWLAIITGYPFVWLYSKTKVYYENKSVQSRKLRGGALIISNHYSVWDFVQNMFLLLPRKLNVVAGEIAYKNKFLVFGMKFFGGVQANRVTKSLSFIDSSIRLIKDGQLVQIFPEGHNNIDGKIAEFKPTYLMIALKSGRPIIPIVTDGNYGLFKRAHVIIGEPIDLSDYIGDNLPSKEVLAELNNMVYEKVVSLKSQLDESAKGKK